MVMRAAAVLAVVLCTSSGALLPESIALAPPPTGSAVQAALSAAVARGARGFALPPGDTALGAQLLTLAGARSFTLAGAADGSSTLWFAPGGGVVVANSSNCTVTLAMGRKVIKPRS